LKGLLRDWEVEKRSFVEGMQISIRNRDCNILSKGRVLWKLKPRNATTQDIIPEWVTLTIKTFTHAILFNLSWSLRESLHQKGLFSA
jgi:hypothetical protein